jgi:RecJ-like exonuclease
MIMEKYVLFKDSVRSAAEKFRSLLRDGKEDFARVISHLDADGISAVSIMIKALDRENIRYNISIVQQLNPDILKELAKEDHETYIFTDLGSGNLKEITEILAGRNIIILDHHDIAHSNGNDEITGRNPCENSADYAKLIFVNPHVFGIDGGNEISGAGVVYLFSKQLSPLNSDMAHVAIIGAIGDVQENKGFLRLNAEILEDAMKQGMMNIKEGLRAFGVQTRPLHKLLEYSTDPFIPGVTGSESNAIEFLNQIGIEAQTNGVWRKLMDLSEEEEKKLIAAVIVKRINEKNPDDVLGFNYLLTKEEEGCPLKDAKEFATLLNACGRLDKASLGIGACIGDEKLKRKALLHQQDYKKEIVKAMNWYRDNRTGSHIIKGKNYVIINANHNVMPSMIGTVASMLTKSNEFKEGTLVMGLARDKDNMTKVSLRISGKNEETDLTEVVRRVTEIAGGEAGGHMNAAGAAIKTENEERFIEAAKDIFSERVIVR